MAGEQLSSTSPAPTDTRHQQHQQQPPDEDYIDMDVSTSTFLYFTSSSSPPFEFRHLPPPTPSSKHPMDREPIATSSPADELFYKGKLLPLHLPPRLQMVEKLLMADPSPQRSATNDGRPWAHHQYSPVGERQGSGGSAGSLSANTTPKFRSCNATPSGSCHVSGELNPEEYFHDCPEEFVGASSRQSAKKAAAWSRKFKLLKQSVLGHKLRASGAYLMSFFSTPAGKSSSRPEDSPRHGYTPKEGSKPGRKNPFGRVRKESRNNGIDRNHRVSLTTDYLPAVERKSCSSAIGGGGSSSCSSISSSSSSSSSSASSAGTARLCGGISTGPLLKRSSSVNSDMDSPILGAIAHCKSSHHIVSGSTRKSLSDVGSYSARIDAVTAAATAASDSRDTTYHWRG